MRYLLFNNFIIYVHHQNHYNRYINYFILFIFLQVSNLYILMVIKDKFISKEIV